KMMNEIEKDIDTLSRLSPRLSQEVKERLQLEINLDWLSEVKRDVQEARKLLQSLSLPTSTSTEVMVEERDDLFFLLNIGNEPIATCQSTRGGSLNQGLSAIRDGYRKTVWVFEEGKPIGRTIIRLLPVRRGGKIYPAIVVDKIYATKGEAISLIQELLIRKAERMRVPVLFCGQVPSERKEGVEIVSGAFEVFFPSRKGKYDYSDTLGGLISQQNIWTSCSGTLLTPRETT
ncbi:hypothetical protein J7L13_00340, partial [bacterium]|nr:hypothetical protein [bacterium]